MLTKSVLAALAATLAAIPSTTAIIEGQPKDAIAARGVAPGSPAHAIAKRDTVTVTVTADCSGGAPPTGPSGTSATDPIGSSIPPTLLTDTTPHPTPSTPISTPVTALPTAASTGEVASGSSPATGVTPFPTTIPTSAAPASGHRSVELGGAVLVGLAAMVALLG